MTGATTPASVLSDVIVPSLGLLPARMDSASARLLMLAICGQEANFEHRTQIGGPARGLWQFEKGGGVKGVLTHSQTAAFAASVCVQRDIAATSDSVYNALAGDDLLAGAFARLLLWSDPRPLPPIGNIEAAWAYYLQTWRPGKPHRSRWTPNYSKAMDAVFGVQ